MICCLPSAEQRTVSRTENKGHNKKICDYKLQELFTEAELKIKVEV